MSDAVLGAVLVGGASRRMGRDKASMPLHGMPMAHRVSRVLFDGGVGAVVHVGNIDGVVDRWPGEGPLGGLATAVLHAATLEGVEVVVVAACDQPDLEAEVIATLIAALHHAPAEVAAAAMRTDDGRRHPFPSAWRPSFGAALEALVVDGVRRADAAFGIGPVTEVPGSQAHLADLDTPADVLGWESRRPST